MVDVVHAAAKLEISARVRPWYLAVTDTPIREMPRFGGAFVYPSPEALRGTRKGRRMSTEQKVEVWKNTAAGMRWFQTINRQGYQQGRTVKGGRTFTITPFDRQINQDSAANPEQDHFRNGTYVLVKAAAETNMKEIESPDSLTDAEVLGLVYEVMAKNITIEKVLGPISSPIALQRIHEQLVIADAPPSAIDFTKQAKIDAEGTVPAVERVQVSDAPEEEVIETPRGGIPEADTPQVVETTPEKSHG